MFLFGLFFSKSFVILVLFWVVIVEVFVFFWVLVMMWVLDDLKLFVYLLDVKD